LSHADRFFAKTLDLWLQSWREQDRTGPVRYWDYNMVQNETLRIKAAVVLDQWMEYAKEMGVERAENKHCMKSFFNKQVGELNARTDKYKTEGHKKLIDRCNGGRNGRGYDIDHRGLKAYLDKVMGMDEEEEPEVAQPQRGEYTAHHNGPGMAPAYVVKERGVVVYGSDDLEDINRFLGEAYVKEVAGGRLVLVHQFRDNMEYEVEPPYDEHTKTRLEMTYPWYRKSRIV
jgi:hypothetical protein